MGLEEAKARSPAEVVQTAEGKDFLQLCLKAAKLDADLLEDIADACEINELNALILGSGELSPEQAADKLFLMQDEAKSLLDQCKRQCLKLGVDFGDGSVYVEEADKPAPALSRGAHGDLTRRGITASNATRIWLLPGASEVFPMRACACLCSVA